MNRLVLCATVLVAFAAMGIGCSGGSKHETEQTGTSGGLVGGPIVAPPPAADRLPSSNFSATNPVQVGGACPVNQNLVYRGGPVLQNVVIVNLYWGASAQSGNRATLDGFAEAITKSSFMDYLSEYSTGNYRIGRGRFGGDFEMTPPAGTETGTITDAQITAELFAEINANRLPANDADHLYFIYFPPGLTINSSVAGTSCQSYYGYHYFGSNQGQNVVYAVMPDLGPQGCNGTWGGMAVSDLTTLVAAHELAEAVADPVFPTGWGEVGDPCAWLAPPAVVDGYTVQRCWSNAVNGCAAAPAPGPLETCGAVCTDTSEDPNNCGCCGNVCTSGVCSGSTCQGGTRGTTCGDGGSPVRDGGADAEAARDASTGDAGSGYAALRSGASERHHRIVLPPGTSKTVSFAWKNAAGVAPPSDLWVEAGNDVVLQVGAIGETPFARAALDVAPIHADVSYQLLFERHDEERLSLTLRGPNGEVLLRARARTTVRDAAFDVVLPDPSSRSAVVSQDLP